MHVYLTNVGSAYAKDFKHNIRKKFPEYTNLAQRSQANFMQDIDFFGQYTPHVRSAGALVTVR